jgi:hypothetical protein
VITIKFHSGCQLLGWHVNTISLQKQQSQINELKSENVLAAPANGSWPLEYNREWLVAS